MANAFNWDTGDLGSISGFTIGFLNKLGHTDNLFSAFVQRDNISLQCSDSVVTVAYRQAYIKMKYAATARLPGNNKSFKSEV